MIGQLLDLLDTRGRRQMVLLVAGSTLSALLELGGVTSIVPFMALASRPDLVQGNALYLWLGQPDLARFLLWLGLLCLLMLTVSNALNGLCNWISMVFAQEQQTRLSRHLYGRYLNQPYEFYLDNHPNTLGFNLSQTRSLVHQGFLPLVQICSRLVSVTLLVGTLLYLHPLVTAASLVALITIYGLVYSYCRSRIQSTYHQEWEISHKFGRTVGDALAGIKHVRLSAGEAEFEQTYTEQLEQMARNQEKRQGYQQIPMLALQTLTYSSLLAMVVGLVYLYGGGARVVGEAALYGLVAYRLLPQVQTLFQNFSHLDSGRTAVDKLYPEFKAGYQPLPQPDGDIRLNSRWQLQNLTYAYGENPPVLQGVNLTIERNRCIGLLGPSGQGKTTLVNVLVGLLKPQGGQLLVDGRELEPAELRSFQSRIGYVPQDIFLSDDSILHNIVMGDSQPDPEKAREAGRQACLDEFVLPLASQYETKVGDRGLRLSGGQRQRIGIARALYRNPDVLVLDEATSALDHGTEAEIMLAIRSLAGTRTIVLVAHRLTTLQYCDQVYRVENGQLHCLEKDEARILATPVECP